MGAVRVTGHEVGRGAHEGCESAVGGDRTEQALAVCLVARRVDADSLRAAEEPVPDERVQDPAHVPRDQVACAAEEDDEAPVGRNRGRVAESVTDGSVGRDADQFGRSAPKIADEDVQSSVRIAVDEIARGAVEHHVASIAGNQIVAAHLISLGSVGGHADALSHPGPSVVNEHVPHRVRVGRNEGRGAAEERHVATVGGDGAGQGIAVALRAIGRYAHSLRRTGLTITNEHVEEPVGVSGNEIGGYALEGHVASVAGDRFGSGVRVTLGASRGDAH